MMWTWWSLLLATVQTALPAVRGGELTAILSYETVSQGSDGVTRETRYQERFERVAGHVWMERVLPANGPKPATGHGHELDLVRTSRHIVPAAGGGVHVELVSVGDRLVVDVAPDEYGRVDVGAHWDDSWYLVAPAVLETLRPSGKHADVAGARWLERRNGDQYMRVLWSDALAFPLVIERGRNDGTSRMRMQAKLIDEPAVRPWSRLASFRRQELHDYGD
jgi:hypothetical protein